MNSKDNIRLLTKAEMCAVSGGGDDQEPEEEVITVVAPSYPPLTYAEWIGLQTTTTWTVSGGGSVGVANAGGSVAVTGYDLNSDGVKDTENEKFDAYRRYMDGQGYAIP